MTAATHPTPPAWVPLLDVDRLRLELGRGTVDRGEAYHRQGRVLRYAVTEQGTVVTAAVAGSRGRPYTSTIALDWPEEETSDALAGLEPDELEWSCSCTCPMGGDCKHVVATILALTGAAPTTRHTAQGPEAARRAEWQALLDPIVRAAPTAGATTANPDDALGLLVEVSLARQRAGQAEAAPSLRLRPVARGSNGNWVRTGISWHDLEYGARAGRADPAQRAAIRAFQLAERAHSTHYYSSYSSQTLDPGALGPTLWHLLDDAVAAGVAIVTGQRGQLPVHVTTEPLDPQLDLSRTPDGDVLVVADVAVPGTDGPLQFIGSPPHGGFVQTSAGLTLARFASPLSPALADLVRRHGEIIIPAPDVDRFLTSYSPTLRRLASVGSHDGSVVLPEVRPPRLALRVATLGDHRLRLHWSLRYSVGDGVIDVPLLRHAPATGDSTDPVPRDPGAEEALLSGIVALDELGAVAGLRVPKPGLSRLALVLEPDLAGMDTVVFLRDVLPVLKARDDVDVTVVGELLTYVESTATPVVAVSASDPGDPPDPAGTAPGRARVGDHGDADGPQLDWFDLGIDVSVDGRSVPLSRLLQALAADETHLILDDGTWFSLDVPTLHSLRRIVDEARTLQDRPSDGLKINRFQAGLWAELVELGVVAHQGERWSRAVEPLLGLGTVPRPGAPAGLLADLRPYQLEGYQWVSLLWDHQLGGILADDMGLGKTLQALAMAERARSAGTLTPDAPLLVVAPTSVVSTWVREAARFTPELRVVTLTETQRRSGTRVAEAAAGAHVVVTSYAIFRIDEDAFRTCAWGGLVLDEAQFVKNHQARTYAAARRLPAPFKLAITGTPLENSLMDLWALLSIVAPGLFPSPQSFGALYRRPIESGTSPELLETLRRRIRPLMLRRTKESVAPDLPPKVEQVMQVELDPRHRRIYDRHLARERQRILGLLGDVDRNRIAILSALTKLRQLSLDVHLVEPDAPANVPSSKVEALIEQLVEVAAEGHRCLVFSQFTGFLAIVRRRLDEAGLNHVYLDGRTRDRPKRIASFVEGDAPVFVISLKAGGSGLTLTEADYVFVLDPWWNPAVEAQAIDRAHRIGQDKTVMVYRLVSEGTIEEKVLELQDRKRELFAKVVDEGGLMGAPLTADDIRGLLGVVSDPTRVAPDGSSEDRGAARAASAPALDAEPAAEPTDAGATPARESSAAEVRAWARSQGLPVGDRGRLSPEIWDAYRQHPGSGARPS